MLDEIDQAIIYNIVRQAVLDILIVLVLFVTLLAGIVWGVEIYRNATQRRHSEQEEALATQTSERATIV
jgi:uncharacterized membrane protein affecting hemolysin expression